jgi:putative chitinase
MTPETLANAVGCGLLRAATYAAPLSIAMQKWGIDSPLRMAGLLGQIAHESSYLSIAEESLNYSAQRMTEVWPARFPTIAAAAPFAHNSAALGNKTYGGRMGNTGPNDGYFYRGRGLLQVTGKNNYFAYKTASGVDVVAKPELLVQPEYSTDSAAWIWSKSGCNAYADARDWRGLTHAINNGYIGLAERTKCIEKAIKALGA